ncbi:transporter substrate-binding domain-containing protein [Streptomyces sp. GQFP]|uniref:transporter substrate-binding domain-containing protein n=1 Tax=Streptomyces sp. GQFP TaxID=2907545 RepID=UPI001F379029|nr:transporter substrate-binding domain-containing protein [Streptomyces sp. GQFP]UIX33263.1 transporter substrate-binding domain-containing protein [Streptomyces sp. GQFP]
MRLVTRLRLAAVSFAVLATASCFGRVDDPGAATPSAPAPSNATSTAASGRGGPAFPKNVDIGVKIDQPGFSQLNTSAHEYSGFEPELAKYLGKHLGFAPNLEGVTSKKREEWLISGVVQLVIATYTITAERLKEVDFVGPYLQTRQGLLVRADDTEIKTRADTAGQQICTVSGSTSDPAMGNPFKDAEFSYEQDYKACVKQLRDGNVDAVWTDRVILYGFTKAYDDVRVVDKIKVGKIQRYGIGLPKHQKAQCERLAEQLQKFLDDEWLSNFEDRFPNIVDAEPNTYEPSYKPADGDVDTYTVCTP